MKFYTVEEDYIKHLRKVDDKVRKSKGDTLGDGARPYIGVVLNINGIDYLAPLTSYSKDKHDKFERIPNDSLISFKMFELTNMENRLGMVQLNNMIPVSSAHMRLIDIDSLKAEDEKYANLLTIQQQYLRKHQDDVLKRAKRLYGIVNAQNSGKAKVNFMGNMSCDFKALEAAMADYQPPTLKPATQDQLAALVGKSTS